MGNKNTDRWLLGLTIVVIFNSIVSVWASALLSIHGGAIYNIKEYAVNNFEWIEKLNTKILKLEVRTNHKVCYYFNDKECGRTKYCPPHITEELCLEKGGEWLEENEINYARQRAVYFENNHPTEVVDAILNITKQCKSVLDCAKYMNLKGCLRRDLKIGCCDFDTGNCEVTSLVYYFDDINSFGGETK